MKDAEIDPESESTYECFDCGELIVAETAPSQCPNCGGAIRNRQATAE